MTGFPDDPRDGFDGFDSLDGFGGFGGPDAFRGPDGFGGRDGGPGARPADPLERLLRPPGEFLPVPPGAFERIRRRAARRRRTRALAGGAVVAAMITGSVYLVGSLGPEDSGEVVAPPASSSRVSHTPATTVPPDPAPSTAEPRQTSGGGLIPATSVPAPTRGGASGPLVPTATPAPSTTTPSTTTPQCTADQLTASLGGGDAGAGNLYRYLVLTNHGGTTCHVAGFPGLSLLDAKGAQIGAPATRQQLSYVPVVLAPGASASDTIHTANQQGSCLPASAQLRVYPPGSRASLVVPGTITNCDNLFTVTPFTAGSTGNPPG